MSEPRWVWWLRHVLLFLVGVGAGHWLCCAWLESEPKYLISAAGGVFLLFLINEQVRVR